MTKVGFIGCGNMGGALLKAVAEAIGGESIFASDFFPEKAESIAEETNATACTNETIASQCDYIFLGVKPQMMEELLIEITPFLKKRTDRFILVSMAAGLSAEAITNMCRESFPVIRIMPNTPCKVGSGVILYAPYGDVKASELDDFEKILKEAGIIDRIPENMIDAASAVSGCGPAFVYMFIEALSDGGVLCGLPRDKALRYAAQTVSGAAQMLLETNMHPGALKDAVTSPGGTTIAGVRALEEGAFRASAMNSVIKAYERTLELKK